MDETKSPEIAILLMAQDIASIKSDVTEIKTALKIDYVSRTTFEPVRKVVYGLVGLSLLGVGGGILKMILGV